MRTWICLCALGVCLITVRAGDLTGTVSAQGKEGTSSETQDDKYGSRKYKFAERIDYASLRDFVVYIDGPLGTNFAGSTPVQVVTTRRINQKGAAFSPHVLPVVIGTTVEWPNEDDILHNVFSISDAKPFDLGLYKHPEVKRVTFDHAGRVDAFCSIHKAMSCIILVLENPYFATADERGRYQIGDVPPGTYKVTAWHERLPKLTKEVTIPEQGNVHLDFTMGIVNLPKY
jgi:plastocyanin